VAKQGGLGGRFYLGGADISGDIQSAALAGGPAVLDVTDITQSAVSRLGGLRSGSIGVVSYWDPLVAHPVLSALPVTDTVATYAVGAAVGQAAACCNGLQLNYDGARGTDGSYLFKADVTSDGYGLEWGQLLTPGMRTDTAATAASSANSLDTGGSLAFGGQAYLHAAAITGTSVTATVWDSADNVTFTAVAGFAFGTVAAAPAAQRVAISNAATIRRYVAVATTGTFTNAQFAVVLAKNTVAGQVF
jgi:hypothetical protein